MWLQCGDAERAIQGNFRIRICRRGRLIETYEDHNLIVNGARDVMARLIAGDGEGKTITSIALGTNGAIPTPR
jgi:hypothetical protein